MTREEVENIVARHLEKITDMPVDKMEFHIDSRIEYGDLEDRVHSALMGVTATMVEKT